MGFSTYTIVSSANKNNFSSFHSCKLFLFFCNIEIANLWYNVSFKCYQWASNLIFIELAKKTFKISQLSSVFAVYIYIDCFRLKKCIFHLSLLRDFILKHDDFCPLKEQIPQANYSKQSLPEQKQKQLANWAA